ncbi:MAG: hypothetical protein UY62_C0039G0009 [Parcubacteria group bacterium GW2011_GWF2_50_9]|nr:MAG: hypothetical protein UY62_C0039G0009 [Parcubacteria group bacterium GW2011_GWF2_50_9]
MGPTILFGGLSWFAYWFIFTPTSVDGRSTLVLVTVFLAVVAVKCDHWIEERNSRQNGKTR